MPPSSPLDLLLQKIQKTCLPGIWSKGVTLARSQAVSLDSHSESELVLRARQPDRPVAAKVSLWPEDEDWFCDCPEFGENTEVCAHVAAAAIAVKAGAVSEPRENPSVSAPTPPGVAQVVYRFHRKGQQLAFERKAVFREREEPIPDTLVSFVGGIGSGRIAFPTLSATREDFALDSILKSTGPATREPLVLDRGTMARLIPALSGSPQVTLDGKPIRASTQKLRLRARIRDDGQGFRIQALENEDEPSESFSNGATLSGDLLRAQEELQLDDLERELLSPEGRFFPSREASLLVSDILPRLEAKVQLSIETRRLPTLVRVPPRAHLQLERKDERTLLVYPTIVYGDPPIAELTPGGLESRARGEVPARDPAAEARLIRKLQQELHLRPGHWSRFEGPAAVELTSKLKGWDTSGDGEKAFARSGTLTPRLRFTNEGGFDLVFTSSDSEGRETSQAEATRVFEAWSGHQGYVPLLGGGWASLPRDWLEKFGPRISALLAARGSARKLPTHLIPEAAALAEENGDAVPDPIRNLRRRLEHYEGIPEAPLPTDLRAELRSYQRTGVNWLSFLKSNGMGAMLADDMGLGKTLQALCAVEGRTLIVCPTSVLQSWTEQIRRFRPGLSLSLYYGAGRKLDPGARITLTTYALLRLDRALLTGTNWETIILDEAQMIKNPESQVAKAAHDLRGSFRIALSGTPVENRLSDLWSQFQFLNPGLLGSHEVFRDGLSAGIDRGDRGALTRLRTRIKPFILRRLKRDVAPELPPRTEVVLQCELSETERDTYDALFAASRRQVLDALEAGGGVMAALELLLRLRQACCHTGLIPGQVSESSSKVELLIETLKESIDQGHRALIFSQWTSLLDRIEPRLRAEGIAFSRLDGSTPDREKVVRDFQAADGPPAMLLSLKAGGVGLTLTAADHIFLMDPWWNPAVEDQAADRAHRIGQTNPVLIQRLIARDTVEEKILELQKKKQALAGSLLEDGAAAASLTREDLAALLET